MNGNDSYAERNSINYNRGEDIFLKWAETNNLTVTRLGFDEKNAPVPRFYDLPPFIRNLPDFIVTSDSKMTLVNVKGSLNFKQQEFEMLEGMAHLYDSENAPLYYCFALPTKLVWKTLTGVSQAYIDAGKGREKVWPDGKAYRTLRI